MNAPLVIVIEASDELRRALEDTLGQRGYRVRGVPTEEAALEELRKAPVDLVIADLTTPFPSGADPLARLHEVSPALRSILLTVDEEDPAESWLDPNAERRHRHLRKPFALHQLVSLSRRMLAGSDDTSLRA